MRVLFDQGTPAPLRRSVAGHSVSTAHEMGWAELDNGRLLKAAEEEFDVFVTTGRNIRHQQNLEALRLAILVLPTTSWPKIQAHIQAIAAAIDRLEPGEFMELEWPD